MESLLGIAVQSLCQGHRLKSSELYQQREEGLSREKPTEARVLGVVTQETDMSAAEEPRRYAQVLGRNPPAILSMAGRGPGGGESYL